MGRSRGSTKRRTGGRPPAYPQAHAPAGRTRAERRRKARSNGSNADTRRNLIVVGAIALLVIAGAVLWILLTGSNGTSGTPKHALGPGGSEVMGPSGALLVEEYADFQCPACRNFQTQVYPTIQKLVQEGKIRFAFHEFAFLGQESIDAANAATCAGDQGKFWAYHDRIYGLTFAENSGALSTSRLLQLGTQVGLSGDPFASCVKDGTYEQWVKDVTDQGSRAGVSQTPTLIVGGSQVPMPTLDGLTQALAAAGVQV